MKSIIPSLLLVSMILFVTGAFGQLWKQYADSAKLFREQKKMNNAIEFYSKSKEELKKDSGGTTSYAEICFTLGSSFHQNNQYKQAEELYLEAKQIRERLVGNKDPDYASSCNTLANLYRDMAQYEKAETLYLEAKQIRIEVFGKNHPDYATSCNNLAVFYLTAGQYAKAEHLHLEAKQIRENVLGKKHPDYAHSCSNLANLYMQIGQYEKAEPLYMEAKQIREEVLGKDHQHYANSCNNLANLYKSIGLYEKAESLYIEANEINGRLLGKDHPDYARFRNNLALLYRDMGKNEKAEPIYLESRQIIENVLGKDHPDYATICNNLANLYNTMEQYEKAEPLYIEAKQIRELRLGKKHTEYATSCNNLAVLYMVMGKYDKAEPLYLEARQVWENLFGKQHPYYGGCCSDLGTLYRLMHQPLLAEKEFKELFLNRVHNVSSVFQFTNEKEKTAFLQNILRQSNKALSFYVSSQLKSELPYSLCLFYRNLILSSSQTLKKELFSSEDPTILNKYNEWINLKKNLSIQYSKPVRERKEGTAEIEEKAGQLEKELTRLSSSFKKQQHKVDLNDIKSKLQADEAAIEFASFQYYNGKRVTDTDSILYVALVLRKDSTLPSMVHLFSEKQLANLLSSSSDTTTKNRINGLYTSRSLTEQRNTVSYQSIYDLIWEPLEKELKGIKTIYFAPSGMLHRIAFAALPVNKKEVLSDRYKLVQLTTTASVIDQRLYFLTASDKIQLYGDIRYKGDTTALKNAALTYHQETPNSRPVAPDLAQRAGWKDLLGTKKEIEGIISLSGKYKTNITAISGINATEESVKALDGKASPAVLHFATHGFFFPDSKEDSTRSSESGKVFKLSEDPLMRSGLLFAGANYAWQNDPIEGIDDGILTAYEVSNLYLPNTKLAVLSACETGLGDIKGSEGVYGLQRSFKMAGIEHLVMSLWKVPDAKTAEFMQEFYKNLFAKQSVGDAFYNAQKVMKNKYRSEPYNWAAWVLVR